MKDEADPNKNLLESCQRYKFKSNSQLDARLTIQKCPCWNLVKDINSKAIHNNFVTSSAGVSLLESCQRYKFKSNSQPISVFPCCGGTCWNLVKDINSKAIHN